jgi:enamine deaminase RidA (YjgF/YER057c/UK114 family)
MAEIVGQIVPAKTARVRIVLVKTVRAVMTAMIAALVVAATGIADQLPIVVPTGIADRLRIVARTVARIVAATGIVDPLRNVATVTEVTIVTEDQLRTATEIADRLPTVAETVTEAPPRNAVIATEVTTVTVDPLPTVAVIETGIVARIVDAIAATANHDA